MKTFSRTLLIAFILIPSLTTCAPAKATITETPPLISASPAPTEWLYEDLLLLDPIDAPTPDDSDLFAVYYQQTEDDWAHIRLDILRDDFSNCQIVLDIADIPPTSEANKSPHLVLNISYNNGIWHAVATQSNDSSIVIFPILIDELQETHSVIVSFQEKYLMKERPMKIVMTNFSDEVIDSATVTWDPSPPAKAPLLLAFWDVLPANTPAQLLQRWDGAHTGPYGSRHGLKHLLAAVEEYQVPVALLDLKNPGTLAGLDMIGQIDYIQQLEEQDLLILPETGVSLPEIATEAAFLSRSTARKMGFSASDITYGTFFNHKEFNYNSLFAYLESQSHIFSIEGQRIIPLPYSPWEDNTTQQVLEVNRYGLTRETWQTIIDTALSTDDSDILVIGGSIITSPWADSSIAPAAFKDLSTHPWIDVLSLENYQTLKTNNRLTELPCTDLLCTPDQSISTAEKQNLLRFLNELPISDFISVWDMAIHNLRPTGDSTKYQLQSNYWEQYIDFRDTSRMSNQFPGLRWCNSENEEYQQCFHVSYDYVTSFKMGDASLSFAFHRDHPGNTQWVGPTSQIVVGLSDPTFWDLNAGTYSDPSVIPGSFILNTAQPPTFEISELEDDHIRFTSTDGSISKDYRFTEEELTVTIETNQPLSTNLVLALDPQQRFQPDWSENYNLFSQTDGSFCWGAEDGKAVCISWTDGPNVEINTFKDSLESLSQPLDPNKVYPPGHFLPMSLATVTFSTDKDFSVTLSPYPNP